MAEFGVDSAASRTALNGNAEHAAEVCHDGFTLLVKRQSLFVFRVAFSVVRNVQDAEDVVQETFLKVYRSGDVANIRDEKAFLARVAWRLAVDRIKRSTGCLVSGDSVDETPSVEARLMQADSEAALQRLIDSLPLDLRLPLALSTVEGMKSPEIARVMGIAEGTVRTRMARARAILKEKFVEWEARRGSRAV